MVVSRLKVDDKTRGLLGEDVLADLKASLWPVDCQSCGQPLGGLRARALVVHSDGPAALASLHHARCLAPGWHDVGERELPALAHTTWRTRTFLTRPHGVPLLFVNPSYEAAILHRDPRWRVVTSEAHLRAAPSPQWSTDDHRQVTMGHALVRFSRDQQRPTHEEIQPEAIPKAIAIAAHAIERRLDVSLSDSDLGVALALADGKIITDVDWTKIKQLQILVPVVYLFVLGFQGMTARLHRGGNPPPFPPSRYDEEVHVVCGHEGQRDHLAQMLEQVFGYFDEIATTADGPVPAGLGGIELVVRDGTSSPLARGDVSIGTADSFMPSRKLADDATPPFGGSQLLVVLPGAGEALPDAVRALYPRTIDLDDPR
jgi:hypothetical protein